MILEKIDENEEKILVDIFEHGGVLDKHIVINTLVNKINELVVLVDRLYLAHPKLIYDATHLLDKSSIYRTL